jgi:hypothetical protein
VELSEKYDALMELSADPRVTNRDAQMRYVARAQVYTDELVRRYVEVLMGFLEDAGQIAVTRDDRGRPTNVRILRGGGISAPRPGSMGGGELTVTSPEEPEPPQGREDGP